MLDESVLAWSRKRMRDLGHAFWLSHLNSAGTPIFEVVLVVLRCKRKAQALLCKLQRVDA